MGVGESREQRVCIQSIYFIHRYDNRIMKLVKIILKRGKKMRKSKRA
jgi:hypothetical protein